VLGVIAALDTTAVFAVVGASAAKACTVPRQTHSSTATGRRMRMRLREVFMKPFSGDADGFMLGSRPFQRRNQSASGGDRFTALGANSATAR
jgi:hypothetical protein